MPPSYLKIIAIPFVCAALYACTAPLSQPNPSIPVARATDAQLCNAIPSLAATYRAAIIEAQQRGLTQCVPNK